MDRKKAVKVWKTAAEAGDNHAPALVADELFKRLTDGRLPNEGRLQFRGGVSFDQIKETARWYGEVQRRDDRPEATLRAARALVMLEAFVQVQIKVQQAIANH